MLTSYTYHRGRAGIGKTTLVQWLLNQWAQKKWAKKYTCAFMLNLRFLFVHEYRVSLIELLTMCSLYNVGGQHLQLGLWMENCQQKLLLFMGKYSPYEREPEGSILIKCPWLQKKRISRMKRTFLIDNIKNMFVLSILQTVSGTSIPIKIYFTF